MACARTGIIPLLLAFSSVGVQAAGSAQVVLNDSIKSVQDAPGGVPLDPSRPFISRAELKAEESAAKMTFEVSLKMRNLDQLQARVAKGERVSLQEMAEKYEPLPSDYQATVAWLTGEGLTITRRDPHHMAVFARGTVSQIGQAMQVNFARVTSNGHEYTSAVTAPSAPASIAAKLVGINGLQPHSHKHKHSIFPAGTAGAAPYSPAQIAQAYQATGLYNTNITGAGQSIAIIIDTFPSTGDVISFWQANSIAQSIGNLQFIQAVPVPSSGNNPPSGEETLDVEWSSSIAPGAKVRVYATTDLLDQDLDAAYAQVYADVTAHPELGIHQMSMSYGGGEAYTSGSQLATDDGYFLELANAGVTIFASAGDEGSTPDGNGGETGPLNVESPASDPNVTGVGGTTLKLNTNNTEKSEVVWNDGASGGATGGGTSGYNGPGYFNRPSWQTGTGVPAGAYRLVPDIACTADENYGATLVYGGSTTVIGGTSWSSPTCAAFCALINQACANVGHSPVGLLGPQIYTTTGRACFRDITSGNNETSSSGPNYTATTGYDECTGVGVPLVQTLAQTLAGTTNLIGVSQQPAALTVDPGENATFKVTASGSPVSYRWQGMPIGTTIWSNLADNGVYSGSATASLTVIDATTAMSGDQFRCVVTYAGATTVTSAPSSTLIVEAPLIVSTLAGQSGVTGLQNGSGTGAQFYTPCGTVIDSAGNLYVADLDNNVIRKVTAAGAVTTPYGSLSGTAGSTNSNGNNALFNLPRDLTFDSSNNLYVSDEGNNLIRKINLSTTQVTTYAGPSTFSDPKGLVFDTSGNLFVVDSGNDVIQKITTGGSIAVFAGQYGVPGYADGTGTTQALFNGPTGMAIDSSNNLYVADYGNNLIRKITPGGTVSTVAGQANVAGYVDGPVGQALFNVPRGVTVDSSGNLYVTDSYAPITAPPFDFAGNNVVRKITPAGVVSTLAGQAGTAGSTDGTGTTAQFFDLCGIALNASTGTFYMVEQGNDTVRRGTPSLDFFTSLFFQNGTSLGILNLNAAFLPIGWQGIGGMGSGWKECAIADINGDGVPDIIFQNGTLIGALIMNANGTPNSWVGIGSMNTGWQLHGAASITDDGNLDLIFQDGTLLGYLEVNKSGAPVSWTGIGGMGTGWQLRAVASMDGTGHPDLLFQNGTALGALQVSTTGVPTTWNSIGTMSSGWILSDAVDVNNDGQPDLIFQNGTTLGALQVNTSFQPVAWHGIGSMSSGWTLPGDY